MSSLRQIEANRRNSLKSTGPRSPEGKAVSCFNALKSGIHAQAQVIPGEDPAGLEALAADYHQQWRPASPLECFLVDALVHADWQLRRLRQIEAQLWTNQISETKSTDLGQVYCGALGTFTRLRRRIDATERSYYRALTQLQRLQVTPAISPPLNPPDADPELASFREIALVPNPAPPAPAFEPSARLDAPLAPSAGS